MVRRAALVGIGAGAVAVVLMLLTGGDDPAVLESSNLPSVGAPVLQPCPSLRGRASGQAVHGPVARRDAPRSHRHAQLPSDPGADLGDNSFVAVADTAAQSRVPAAAS